MMNDFEIMVWVIQLEQRFINPDDFMDEMQEWALAVKR